MSGVHCKVGKYCVMPYDKWRMELCKYTGYLISGSTERENKWVYFYYPMGNEKKISSPLPGEKND